jgi:cell division protein FtsN
VGEFGSREEAERTARRLNVDGFSSNLVESEDGMFRLEVGSYYNLNKAIDLARTLQEKKYTPKIDSKAVPTPVHQVRVGEYESRTEALKALEALKRQGFTPLIVRQ